MTVRVVFVPRAAEYPRIVDAVHITQIIYFIGSSRRRSLGSFSFLRSRRRYHRDGWVYDGWSWESHLTCVSPFPTPTRFTDLGSSPTSVLSDETLKVFLVSKLRTRSCKSDR